MMKLKGYINYDLNKRFFDLIILFFCIIIFIVPILIIYITIRITSKHNVIHWSERIGKDNIIFKMPKFRTMRVDTPSVATHLLSKPEIWVTPVGKFLRKFSLDELPQLWSVFKGKMSFVGPRPALYNQKDLINLRTKNSVHKILPGITGLAQINGRDKLSIKEKALFDIKYLKDRTLILDIKIILITLKKMFSSSGVTH